VFRTPGPAGSPAEDVARGPTLTASGHKQDPRGSWSRIRALSLTTLTVGRRLPQDRATFVAAGT